jgi:dTMP kinase
MGLWIVFEGPDGVGKTTIMTAVAEELQKTLLDHNIISTNHPGATPLGIQIRRLTKNPEELDNRITIDPLAMQTLMAADHINFKTTILLPELLKNSIILADRCNLVSGLIYGLATGLNHNQISHLLDLTCNPRIDQLFILTCPLDIAINRKRIRNEKLDSFEIKGDSFQSKISNFYNNILLGPPEQTILLNRAVALENIKFINTEKEQSQIVKEIVNNIRTLNRQSYH